MKKKFCICITFILFNSFDSSVLAQATLSGSITDQHTKLPLPGATVYIPDLKTGSAANAEGKYSISKLPKHKLLVQVKYIGYKTLTAEVNPAETRNRDFELSESAIETGEVIVTGSAFTTDRQRSSVAVTAIDKMTLLSATADNLVSAIARTPGVSEISTGNGISKPVIRGLAYNRIVTIKDGVRQEGQQWGDEHGLEIDQFSADRIEILKGPASLLYGSDALGGVIHILEPLPAPVNTIGGEASAQYASNNRLSGNSLMLEGNHSGFVWRTRGTYKSAAPYRTPAERVYNSAFHEWNGEGFIGLNKHWGYAHVHASRWDSSIGLIEGKRDSLTGKLTDGSGNMVPEEYLNSRELFVPFQNVRHWKAASVNSIFFGKSRLKLNAGYQVNHRQEFESSIQSPGMFLHLNTITCDLKYYFPESKGLETVIGIQGMRQQNENKGEEFLVPDYDLLDLGGFASVKKSLDKLTLNAGVRYDGRKINSRQLEEGGEILFASFTKNFSEITGSAGGTYRVSESVNVKANTGRGFRAPNISELSANGVHEGTFRYEIGNTGLKPETSLQFDLSVSYESKSISAELNGFYNRIDHFIYYRNQDNEILTLDGKDFPVYRYVQGNSELRGFEALLDLHPVNRLHIENSVSWLEGVNRETKSPLPFIPAAKIHNEIKYYFKNIHSRFVKEIYIRAFVESHLKQSKYDEFEKQTGAYSLLNAGAGCEIIWRGKTVAFYINANNISDKKYYDHLSRLKEKNILNAGRNFIIGLNIPFILKEIKSPPDDSQ